MRNRSAAVLVTMMLAATITTVQPAYARPEGDFIGKVNAERRARGMRELVVRDDLTAVARRHSQRMASRGRISHNPNLKEEVSGWRRIGENVGRGPSVRAIHRAFMSSSTHRDVILQPAFNQIGVGVAWRGDTMYVTQVFVERGSSGGAMRTIERRSTRSRTTARAARSTARAAEASQNHRVRAKVPIREPRAVGTVRALRRMQAHDDDVLSVPSGK